MTLPTPNLDDRRFQDIVDEAKRLIPQLCPEWTDHNVSDPGVTLIELFAWMTELLLYRVNQIPEKSYTKFLDFIGVRLRPPTAARVLQTFCLTAAQGVPITIPLGTEISTARSGGNDSPIVFTTEAELTIVPAEVVALVSRESNAGKAGWTRHDLRALRDGRPVALLPQTLWGDDGFYIGLQGNHSQHVLSLMLRFTSSAEADADAPTPSLQWQAWQGRDKRWASCEIEEDKTGGCRQSGEVVFRTPRMEAEQFEEFASGVSGYWLRCVLPKEQAGARKRTKSLLLEQIVVEAKGGSVWAHHATTVVDEKLGTSTGKPGQMFRLRHSPVLARDPKHDRLVVQRNGKGDELWAEVEDFGDSREDDRHYTLDPGDGTVTLPPHLPQPDGRLLKFGATPPANATICFSRYQHGGGVAGNVPAGTLIVLRTAVPYVAHVRNWQPASGGAESETLAAAQMRAQKLLRTRRQAVTAEDYEYFAGNLADVARVRCITPGRLPSKDGHPQLSGPRPGTVAMVLIPRVGPGEEHGYLRPDQLVLSAVLRERAHAELERRRLVGTSLEVRPAHYIWVRVEAKLRLLQGVPQQEAEGRAMGALNEFINPLVGGAAGTGWPFGRDLFIAEVYAILQGLPVVDVVAEVRLEWASGPDEAGQAAQHVRVPDDGVICSGLHQVTFI